MAHKKGEGSVKNGRDSLKISAAGMNSKKMPLLVLSSIPS